MQAVYEHVDRAVQWDWGEVISKVVSIFFAPAFSRCISLIFVQSVQDEITCANLDPSLILYVKEISVTK